MAASSQSSINLGLPAIPETTDPKLFGELIRIYNAIKLLAQGVDVYTNEGAIVNQVDDSSPDLGVMLSVLGKKLKAIALDIETTINTQASLAELNKQYYKRFTRSGKFACNGKVPQASVPIATPAPTAAPAGGVGTAAGGWDTAAHRDTAIATINSNSAAITEIQNILKQFGLAS